MIQPTTSFKKGRGRGGQLVELYEFGPKQKSTTQNETPQGTNANITIYKLT